jgi:hypothetical protein
MKNKKELIYRLDEVAVYLTKLIIHEVDHDPKLVEDGKEHIKTLMLIHTEISKEDEAALE